MQHSHSLSFRKHAISKLHYANNLHIGCVIYRLFSAHADWLLSQNVNQLWAGWLGGGGGVITQPIQWVPGILSLGKRHLPAIPYIHDTGRQLHMQPYSKVTLQPSLRPWLKKSQIWASGGAWNSDWPLSNKITFSVISSVQHARLSREWPLNLSEPDLIWITIRVTDTTWNWTICHIICEVQNCCSP